MTQKFNQLQEYDIVLGDQATALADSVVLEGLARIKQLLASGGIERGEDTGGFVWLLR